MQTHFSSMFFLIPIYLKEWKHKIFFQPSIEFTWNVRERLRKKMLSFGEMRRLSVTGITLCFWACCVSYSIFKNLWEIACVNCVCLGDSFTVNYSRQLSSRSPLAVTVFGYISMSYLHTDVQADFFYRQALGICRLPFSFPFPPFFSLCLLLTFNVTNMQCYLFRLLLLFLIPVEWTTCKRSHRNLGQNEKLTVLNILIPSKKLNCWFQIIKTEIWKSAANQIRRS